MKLSKKSLETIIRGAIDMEGESHFAFHVLESLRNDCLEIEGYERSGWTKFDPNDPKTFPPKNGNYLVVYFDEIRIVEWYNTFFIAEGSKSYVFSDCVSYWMPLPEMPNKK